MWRSCHPNDEGVVMALLVSTLAALFCTVMVTDAGVHGDQRSDRVAHLRQHSMVSSKPRRQIVDDEQSSLMLSCHVCHSFTNESSCVHLADNSTYFSEPCVGLHMSCMVRSLSHCHHQYLPVEQSRNSSSLLVILLLVCYSRPRLSPFRLSST